MRLVVVIDLMEAFGVGDRGPSAVESQEGISIEIILNAKAKVRLIAITM